MWLVLCWHFYFILLLNFRIRLPKILAGGSFELHLQDSKKTIPNSSPFSRNSFQIKILKNNSKKWNQFFVAVSSKIFMWVAVTSWIGLFFSEIFSDCHPLIKNIKASFFRLGSIPLDCFAYTSLETSIQIVKIIILQNIKVFGLSFIFFFFLAMFLVCLVHFVFDNFIDLAEVH